jgi:REP element-mobilizing transposase RayT
LPHVYETDAPVFLTWRLHASLPGGRHFAGGVLTSGEAFVAMDRLLDAASSGPVYLRVPEIAEIVAAAIDNHAAVGHYDLHAFVVMPNHVPLLVTPAVPIPVLTKSLKNFTSLRANRFPGRKGLPFWQGESYDRVVRDSRKFDRIRFYAENNPVRAGIVHAAAAFRWSSAWGDRRPAPKAEQPQSQSGRSQKAKPCFFS